MASPVFRKLADRAPYILLDDDAPSRTEFPLVTLQPQVQSQVVPVKKKKPGSRMWLRFDSSGVMELLELDRNAIMHRASIPARDLRILGPVFSQSSHILARERAMVVNLEFIKAIVTAEELFLLEASSPAVLHFVEQLKEHFPLRTDPSPPTEKQMQYFNIENGGADRDREPNRDMGAIVQRSSPGNRNEEENPDQLPFEFRVLEIALDVVCNFLEGRVRDLELKAYPTLDEFTRNITSSNLELVRNLKSHLTRLTGRVQKVRDELEQLLDDDKDMADLYLTRKLAQHMDSPSESFREDGPFNSFEHSKSSNYNGATSMAPSISLGEEDVEELEMLLEAYFMQLDGTLNKLTMIREYIDDTEDYINIQLDHQRNQLFQFQITLATASLATAIATALCSAGSMNIQYFYLYDPANDIFTPFLLSCLALAVLIFFSVLGYVHWTGLFEK